MIVRGYSAERESTSIEEARRRLSTTEVFRATFGFMEKGNIDAIGKVDINMLAALRLILSERNVGKAALEFGLSQPAMSNALARMRAAFGDPLLVRAHGKMELTTRGQDVLDHLEQLLPQLDRLAQPPVFDPAHTQATFSIAATDHASQVLGPSLVEEFSRQAPEASLIITTMQSREIDVETQQEHFDLRLGWFVAPPPSWFMRKLIDDRMVVITGSGNTDVGATIDVEQFTSIRHVAIRTRQALYQTGMDKMLQERGVRRNVAVWLSNFSAIPQILARSKLLALVPESLAKRYSAQGFVRILEPPVPLDGFRVSMAWSPRVNYEPANRWLRSLVIQSAGNYLRSAADGDAEALLHDPLLDDPLETEPPADTISHDRTIISSTDCGS